MDAADNTWREYLQHMCSSPAERERLAQQLGIHPLTLQRWITGTSSPRLQNAEQLLRILPQEAHPSLNALFEHNSQATPVLQPTVPTEYIESQFIHEVLHARETIADHLRYWTITRMVIQHALQAFNAEQVGMAITVVRCMPPWPDGAIHSLRESIGLGTPPWERDLEPHAIFLGIGSLAGYVTLTRRTQAIYDLRNETSLLPAYLTEHEVSAIASPLLYANRVAGCLLGSSIRPGLFSSPTTTALFEHYAQLIALAFEAQEFYAVEQLHLQVMPSVQIQRRVLATFRRRVHDLMLRQHLSNTEAEPLIWREIEQELIQRALEEF